MSHKQANHCDNKRVPAGFRILLLHTTVQLVTVMHVQAGLPTAIKTWKKRKICIHCPCILQCISVFGFVVSICSVFACFVCFCSEKSVFGHPLVKVTETCCVHFDNRVGFTSGATLSGETLIWANSENLSQDALKIVFILALTSLKRVSNWCTLSVSPSCLTIREDRSTGSLQPNGSFTPKSMKSSFRLRVIFLEPHHHLTSPHNSKGVSPTLQQLSSTCLLFALTCLSGQTASSLAVWCYHTSLHCLILIQSSPQIGGDGGHLCSGILELPMPLHPFLFACCIWVHPDSFMLTWRLTICCQIRCFYMYQGLFL